MGAILPLSQPLRPCSPGRVCSEPSLCCHHPPCCLRRPMRLLHGRLSIAYSEAQGSSLPQDPFITFRLQRAPAPMLTLQVRVTPSRTCQIAPAMDVCVWAPCPLYDISLRLTVLLAPRQDSGATEQAPESFHGTTCLAHGRLWTRSRCLSERSFV